MILRMKSVFLFTVCFLLLFAIVCGKKEKITTQEVAKKRTPSKASTTVQTKKEEKKGAIEQVVYHYNPVGKIDPFRPLIVEETKARKGMGMKVGNLQPLQRFDLDQLNLVGVILNTQPPRALIEDMTGDGYIVTLGTLIGRNEGVVAVITDNEIIVEEKQLDVQGKLVKKKFTLMIRQPEELEEK